MKTLRIVCGAISIALFIVMMFMSCTHTVAGVASGIGEEIGENVREAGLYSSEAHSSSYAAYIICSIVFLISGIVALAGKNSKMATIVSAVFYILAGGLCFIGKTPDIYIFAFIGFVFAGLAIASAFLDKNLQKPISSNTSSNN